MNTIKPSSASETRRQPSPTPSPNLLEPVESLPSEPSSEDAVAALIDAEERAESWILLEARHVLRAADFREIEEAGFTTDELREEETGEKIKWSWPVPSLIVNGKPITRPNWTFEELLDCIGAELKEPPQQRQWIGTKAPPNTLL